MFHMIDFYGRKRKCLELGINLNDDGKLNKKASPKSQLNLMKSYNFYGNARKEIDDRIEATNNLIKK